MNNIQTFISDEFYHVFNKAVDKNLLFRHPADYHKFQIGIKKYLCDELDIYAYSLLPNHFHMLIKTARESNSVSFNANYHNSLSKKWSNLFNSYSKWYNIKYSRKGSLFLRPFKRILIPSYEDARNVILYIHRNPIHHNYVKDILHWKYSSHTDIIKKQNSIINTQKTIEIFDNLEGFKIDHKLMILDWKLSKNYLE